MAKKSSTFDSTSLLQYMFPKDMLKYFEITNAEEEHTGKYDETNTEIVLLHIYMDERDLRKRLRKTYGADNVVSAVLHMDEETPHIHATIVPIVQTERKKQKGGVRDVDNIVEGTRSRPSRRDIGRKPLHPVCVPTR